MKLSFLILIASITVSYAAKSAKNGIVSIKKYEGDERKKIGFSATVDTISVKASVSSPSTGLNDLQKGIATVLGGTLTHLALGTLYCWGNFMSYSPQSLRFFDGKEHPGKQPDAMAIIPITLICQCLTMPFGPIFNQKLGASKTILVGSLVVALGVLLSSYMKELSHFILFYAITFGSGVGIAYTAPMAAGWKWFPDKKGLVTGLILVGFGAGGFIFNILGSKLINPKNLEMINGKFPAEVYDNFPKALRVLAACYASLGLIGSFLVSEPKDSTVLNENSKDKLKSAPNAPQGLEVTEALKTSQFWFLWLMVVSSASAGLNVASIYKQFAATSSALSGDSYQALVGGFGALFNGLGRLFWGVLSDKIGFKKSFMLLTVLQSALHFVLAKSASSKVSFATAICMVFFFLAGNFALMPPAVQRLFGPKQGTLIYGLLFSSFGTASIGGLVVSKILKEKLGWEGTFQIMAGFSLLACAITHFLQPVAFLKSSSL